MKKWRNDKWTDTQKQAREMILPAEYLNYFKEKL